MMGSIFELVLRLMVGCVLLFGVTLVFSGAALHTAEQLIAAFGLCGAIVVVGELVFRSSTDTEGFWDED